MEARKEDASSVGAVQMFETNWNNGMPAKFCAVKKKMIFLLSLIFSHVSFEHTIQLVFFFLIYIVLLLFLNLFKKMYFIFFCI